MITPFELSEESPSTGSSRPRHVDISQGTVIDDRFEVISYIATGGYGDLYSAVDIQKNQVCALKVEPTNTKKSGLVKEFLILTKLKNSVYFPTIIRDGVNCNFRYIAMQLLGPSLYNMQTALPDERFNMYSTLRLSLEMLKCIEEFHKLGYIHRDVKPDNFLIRPDKLHPVCLIDFGLSESYINPVTNDHIQNIRYDGFTGTTRYASVNAHDGRQLSRRDDLMSWFYSVVEMSSGHLPWPGSKDQAKTRESKVTTTPKKLCSNLPHEFIKIYRYIKSLSFTETPKYSMIKGLINHAIAKNVSIENQKFDWEDIPKSRINEISQIPLEMNDRKYSQENVMYDQDTFDQIGCLGCNVM